MGPLRLLFSFSGRLRPEPFALAAGAVYLAGAASQFLTAPAIIARFGLAAFAASQALLIWIWFCLHAKRLRDAGRPIGLAAAASLLYALSIVLLLVVAVAFFHTVTLPANDANSTSALGLVLLAVIIAAVLDAPRHDIAWLMAAILTAVALVPLLVAIALTLWAATQPEAGERKA
jgi:uncharacterized membrane protein YhaH (DUF805 family)